MFIEIMDDELYDLNAGGIISDLGYIIGRIVGEVTQALSNTKWHSYGPCNGDCCNPR